MAKEVSEQELKAMNLHDTKVLADGVLILRVTGGWIYWRASQQQLTTNEGGNVSIALAGAFVPEPK